jgi:hypothetical protein
VPLCKSAGTKELKVVHGASATCVLQNVDSLLTVARRWGSEVRSPRM